MKMSKSSWLFGMVLLLLVAVESGCDDGERQRSRQRELEQQVEKQKQIIDNQEQIIDDQDGTIDIMRIALPFGILVALFVGTLMGLKGKNDAKHGRSIDNKAN